MKRLDHLLPALLTLLVVLSAYGQEKKPTDQWLRKPVDDKTFRTFKDFFTYDSQLPFDTAPIDSSAVQGIHVEHFSFISTPGVRVFVRYYQPAAFDARTDMVAIVLHGGSASGKDAPGIKVLADRLGRDGQAVMAIDMLHFGERNTGLFTSYTEEEKHDRLYNQPAAYLEWIVQNVKDAGRAFDFLVNVKHANPRRVYLIGISRGAIVGTIIGAADGRFAAVILLYGGHFDALERQHLAAACPANYIGRVSPRPLLMVNGDEDTDMIKETSVLPLQRLARPPKTFLWNEGGHRGLPPDEQWPTLLNWLREQLK